MADNRSEMPLDRSPQAAPPVPRDWRQDVVGVSGIVIILGAWLVISPLVLGYRTDDATWNPIICGGFWLADSSEASWNARGAGALMFFLGLVSVAATQPRRAG